MAVHRTIVLKFMIYKKATSLEIAFNIQQEKIAKLTMDKKNLIIQLVEMEDLRDENIRLQEQIKRLESILKRY